MKKILFFAMFLGFFAMSADAQIKNTPAKTVNIDPNAPQSGPIMTFEKDVVDYGTIEQNSDKIRKIKFTNTGTEPLIIKNARASCGCTVPTWTKEPIMPGESSELEISYATNRVGKINKKVTITTNETIGTRTINVVGTVLKAKKEESVPASAPSIINGNN